jgi:hypothetical protein
MDIQFVLMWVSIIVGTLSYLIYIWRLLRGEHFPHPFSWFVWSVTASTIAAAMVTGGAGFGSGPYIVNAALVIVIFVVSIPRGSREISVSDCVFLFVALIGLTAWWILGDPLMAVLLITGIDLLGYFPTYRKIIASPQSESLIAWSGFLVGSIFAILAQAQFSLTTLTYPIAMSLAAFVVIILCLIGGRRAAPR